MSRPFVAVLLLGGVFFAACSTVAGIAGIDLTPNPLSVALPTAILSGDTVLAIANVTHRDGRLESVSATWNSSDPSVISVDASGHLVGHIEGRSATISASYQGQTATGVVTVRSDDKRLGYALADQPANAGPYTPDPTYAFNSSGGAIQVTRSDVGVYSVRFVGLGREAGERDNVQVTGYGTPGVYCKPGPLWSSDGADMVVPVWCTFIVDGSTADSRFSVLLIGARPFGASTPMAFALYLADTGAVFLDTTATARNSTGGHIAFGRVGEGNYASQFSGLVNAASGSPIDIQVTAAGQGSRRCRVIATDATTDGIGYNCVRLGGAPGDSPMSVLIVTKGRANKRFAFAWANNSQSTSNYTPDPTFAFSSSGGAITSRRTGTGTYQVVFSGLARPVGARENVQLSSAWEDGNRFSCSIASWGNTGANDFAVNVACYDVTAAPVAGRFSVLVVE
jgi:hypothetical protein